MTKLSFLVIGVVGLVAAGPARAETWAMRPGLWEESSVEAARKPAPLPADLPPDQRARMEALETLAAKAQSPKPVSRQFCQGPQSPVIGKSIFDPANQPPGACKESITAETAAGRDVENDCALPPMQIVPSAARSVTPPPIPAQAHRHIILAGDGAGTIDRLDTSSGFFAGDSVVIHYRWLGSNCGSVPP